MSSIFDLFKKIESERQPVKQITYIVAGLGNPGKEYAKTRHNAGFMALDLYCEKNGLSMTKVKFNSLTAEVDISGIRVLLMKPQLYMNRSGECIRDAANFYKIPAENVLVLCDDVQLDVGKIRIRRKGSDGGQKGLRDIIYQLNSDAFPRLRIGVGKLPQGGNMVNWVLGAIPQELCDDLGIALSNAVSAIPMLVGGNIDDAMSRYN